MALRNASDAVKLFLTCWIAYGLFFATNVVREHFPAFSLAERASLRVDPYVDLHPDLFEVPGRGAFINNNPGTSIVAGLAYAPVRPLVDAIVARVDRARALRGTPLTHEYRETRSNRVEFFRKVRERGLDVRFGLAIAAIHLLCTAPLSALSVVVMRTLLLGSGFGTRAALWLALLYAFGTPVFFRTGHLNHNLLVAHFTLFAFALLYRKNGAEADPRRLFGAGVLAGLAVLCDYSGVVTLAALGVYALWKLRRGAVPRPVSRTLWMGAGAALPLTLLFAYQAWAFGHPFLPAQHYMPATNLSVQGWSGFDWPSLGLLGANLFDPRFGLFAFGPVLALGFAAPLLVRRGRSRLAAPELTLALGLFGALWLFTGANQYASIQWNTGFRMLVPAVPLLFLATAATMAAMPRGWAVSIAAVAVAHAACLAMVREDVVASVTQLWAHGITLPWLTVLWKMGDQYLPLLQRTGPQSLPLLLVVALAIGFLWWRPRGVHLGSAGDAAPAAGTSPRGE